MAVGYKFPILDSSGAATTTVVDMEDMFVPKDQFLNAGLYAWGLNDSGELGLNDTTHRSSPVQVGALTNWKKINSGTRNTNFYGIKTDGTLWAWGRNDHGQLGINAITHRSSPTQVGTLTNWKEIASGEQQFFAIKTDGTLWACGRNDYGALGLNDLTHRSSPVQVGSLTNWKKVYSGYTHFGAIKTDGTLWTWGYNIQSGALGHGDLTHRSSPTQVGSLTDWKMFSGGNLISAAIKTDGTLWTWGDNAFGRLGQNGSASFPITRYSSPVQVGSLTNWKLVSMGNYNCSAIKTDGTLWAWGENIKGQLGLNDLTSYSSPVQVGALSNWKKVSSGGYFSNGPRHTVAIKTDGTLWTWGFNEIGQLGLNDRTDRSSPVQVGSLTNWYQISNGNQNTIAIASPELP